MLKILYYVIFFLFQTNHSMQGVHASAWSIIRYGQIARKQSLTGVCLDSLSRWENLQSGNIFLIKLLCKMLFCFNTDISLSINYHAQNYSSHIEMTFLLTLSRKIFVQQYILLSTFFYIFFGVFFLVEFTRSQVFQLLIVFKKSVNKSNAIFRWLVQ